MADSTRSSANNKFAFCRQYLCTKKCQRRECTFEHADDSDVLVTMHPAVESGYVIGEYKRSSSSNNNHRESKVYGTTKPLCKFYAKGQCNRGGGCRFLHLDPASDDRINQRNNDRNSQWNNVSEPSTSANAPRARVPELDPYPSIPGYMRFVDGGLLEDCNSKPNGGIQTTMHVVNQEWFNLNRHPNRIEEAFDETDEQPSQTLTAASVLFSSNNGAKSKPKHKRSSPPHTVTSGSLLDEEEWVNAPEFVPKNSPKLKSYAEVVSPHKQDDDMSKRKLCPYAERNGACKFPSGECAYLHGNLCDLCGSAVLHPFNEELRKKHTQDCIKQHERDMELSFAVARSREKTCGVCFEVIMEKSSNEQRFGILPNCSHCFCLSCIRKWRQARQFENKIIRACPECRVTSDFVCPSMYWVETKEDKEKLIDNYKKALAKKNCKYFKQGRGKCPFGNKCFYLHALPDGTKTDVGPPPRQLRRQNQDGDIDMLQQIILWDFLDERDNRWLYLEDLMAFFSDSDDSDWSDYDLFFD